jgi:hypothetical protein
MPRLWLVIPVHGREGLTRLCLEQKAYLVHELAGLGVEAHVLVVGDDANIDTARELGFETLERPNVHLGRKINDGFEWACREGGAQYVSFVGSDDWVMAEFMADFPEPDRVRSAGHQAFVSPGGQRLIVRKAPGPMGGAPWVIPTALLAECGFRPVWRDQKMSGMDYLIVRTLQPKPMPRLKGEPPPDREARLAQKARELRRYDQRPADLLRMVDFKGTREQITDWATVVPTHRGDKLLMSAEGRDVWETLATRYPADLVGRMQKFYAEGRA